MAGVPTIGQMRMVFQFNRPTKSSDDTGGQNEQYEAWFTTRGYLKFRRGLREFQTGYDESIKIYDCWIPWRNEFEVNVTKDTRVIFEARSFAIEHFELVDEQRRLFHIELTEVR